jgi:predicted ribonuclease YlaK
MWHLRNIEFTQANLHTVLKALKRLNMNTVDFCQELEMAIKFGIEKDDQLLIACKDAEEHVTLDALLNPGVNLIKLRGNSSMFTKLFFQSPDILPKVSMGSCI